MAATTKCPQCGATNRLPTSVKGAPRCGKCEADLPWVVAADQGTFTDALATSRLVLVDFWADWCGPCRAVAPVLERLAGRYAGRLKVVKVDVEVAQALAARYRAQSIPLLVFFQGGDEVHRLVGAQPERVLAGTIDRLLAPAAR